MKSDIRNVLLSAALYALCAALVVIIWRDPDGYLEPEIFVPLMIDAALAFSAGRFCNRAVWRFLAWPLIPAAVVYVYYQIYYPKAGSSSETHGFFALVLFYLLIVGFVVSGIACILGYHLRVKARHKVISQTIT